MLIHKSMQMADIIHMNYLLLQVIYRFDIRLGFGNKTVEKVCKENGVNVDFFLEIVNSFHDQEYFPDKELQHFQAALLISYLKNTHDYYLQVKVPEIELLIQELIRSSAGDKEEGLGLLDRFFREYKEELIAHIEREDNVVLPYVQEIEHAYLSEHADVSVYQKIKTYSIDDFAKEHNNVEDKLFDLKNIIIKFLPPVKDTIICNNILIELFRLEKDLNNHALIEDKVLVPKVRKMEKEILRRLGKND